MKTFYTYSILFFLSLMCCIDCEAQTTLLQLGKDSIREIINNMTLKEKASLVVGTGMRFMGKGPVIGEADGKVPGAAGNTMNINRFGIPGTVLADGPAGVRIDPIRKTDSTKTYYATAWPVGTLLASSWDTSLLKKVGVAFGNEIKEFGVDVILGPGMNIQRDPLNGRNFEYYSEDPLLTGYLAAAMVEGIQSNGVGVSIKHFAANNQETNRNTVNAIVSERALREIYLRGFEIAIKKSNPWTVMSSYNKINGTYSSENYDLLTKILRNDWGFKGLVMTDWYGGRDRAAQMKAGNDLIMPGSQSQAESIITAVNNGSLDIAILDQNVERILNYILLTPSFKKYKYSEHPDLKAHALISMNAATEGMVLLKNNGQTLPLKKQLNIALFGNGSYETVIGGTGSGQVNVAYIRSIAEGLINNGFAIDKTISKIYADYIRNDNLVHPKKQMIELGSPRMVPEYFPNEELIEKSSNESAIAIFTISRNAGEGGDRKLVGDFNLSDSEKIVIKNISTAFHAKRKKLVVILNIGGVIETASWKDAADAILLAWQPGIEAGNAIAKVLGGAVNPSGKLATTFPSKYEDIPSAKNFPGTPVRNPTSVVYEEGIYVGYRYFNTFLVKPIFPFGFGLSYTQFSFSNLKLSSSNFDGKITAILTITNTGKISGKEVVQLYLTAPQKEIDKPNEELKAFAKTNLLKPGDSQTISFTLYAKELASFNTNQSAWIADAGIYTVNIGASSNDIKISKNFQLTKSLLVEKVVSALSPQNLINEIRNNK